MTRLLLLGSLCLASAALAADAFPWDGTVTLATKKGEVLTWTVTRADGEVRITGTHPNWRVEHRAKPDGTPLRTVRRAKGTTTTVTYTATGAQVEQTDAKGKSLTATITEPGLWDGDTLDARLAGLPWGNGKKVQFTIVDVEKADGTVYPMRAEYEGLEACSGEPCHHVRLGLGDFRRAFGPKYDYRFATAPGARYLRHDGDDLTFIAR